MIECTEYVQRRYNCRAIVLDHLQKLIPPNTGAPEWKQPEDIASDLQTCAHDTGSTIFAGCHTSKPDEGKNTKPTLYDTRGGAGIAQNSGMIIGVWRDKESAPPHGADGITELGTLKLRDPHGQEGYWDTMHFRRKSQSFLVPDGEPWEVYGVQQAIDFAAATGGGNGEVPDEF
jgi:hypothetical protein